MINITKTPYSGVNNIDLSGKLFDIAIVNFEDTNKGVCGEVALPFQKFNQYYNNDINCNILYENITNVVSSFGEFEVRNLTEMLADNKDIKTFNYEVQNLSIEFATLPSPGVAFVTHKSSESTGIYETTLLNSTLIKTLIGENHELKIDTQSRFIHITTIDPAGPKLFISEVGYIW